MSTVYFVHAVVTTSNTIIKTVETLGICIETTYKIKNSEGAIHFVNELEARIERQISATTPEGTSILDIDITSISPL